MCIATNHDLYFALNYVYSGDDSCIHNLASLTTAGFRHALLICLGYDRFKGQTNKMRSINQHKDTPVICHCCISLCEIYFLNSEYLFD